MTEAQNNKQILRALALQVKEIASDPRNNEEKVDFWKRHISLKGEKPPVFVHPDGAWAELLPQEALQCTGWTARLVEYELRKRLIRHQYIKDDVPITEVIDVPKAVDNSWWGVAPKRIPGSTRGAYKTIPIIENPSDWKQLSMPVITHDEKRTESELDFFNDAIGDVLTIRSVGQTNFSFHLMNWYCAYRGLDNLLYDLYDEPEMIHEVMQFFVEGVKSMLAQYEKYNLLSLNNNQVFHYTGGVGCTDELPAPGFDPDRVRLCDLWGAAEAQEFAQISPEMHEEFVLQYEREILAPFGLNGYGCCDDLSEKLDGVLKINNLRRVAVCPWADIAKFTPVLQKNYIMTWKPKPMPLAADTFDGEIVKKELENGLQKAKGGVIELILRDTHTCKNQPERFGEWVKIARQAIDTVWE
ncbi:MAG: hypothetical protein IJB88_00895 [Clostridia bacterium]|nr:hypothetical protein [Clostridia bacterium]